MKMTRTVKAFFVGMVIVLTGIVSVWISAEADREEYHYLWVLPLAYVLICCLFLLTAVRRQFSIFTCTLLLMSYIRYVSLPAGMVLSGKFSGKSVIAPGTESVNLAFILMVYELFALSLCLVYLSGKRCFNRPIQNCGENYKREFIGFERSERKIIFFLFGMLSLGFTAMIPHTIVNFNFIIPTARTVKNMSNTGTLEQISTVCLSVTKQLFFLSAAIKCYQLNCIHRRILWRGIALLAVILNSCIYTGTNRSDFLLMTTASFLCYLELFPSMKKVVVPVSIVIVGCILPALSSFRKTGIMDYSNGFSGFIASFTNIMWGYSGGPYNVAIATEAAKMFPEGRTVSNLIYDFLRPTFGINLIMQKLPLTYSNVYFNYRYYMKPKVTQIMPMVGEGYFYFGIIGAPLITMFFGWLGLKLADIRKRTRDPLILYFLTITCCRLGFIMGQNATIQMNDLSFNLFIPMVLIFLGKKVSFVRR